MKNKNEKENHFEILQDTSSNWKVFVILITAFFMIIISIFMGIAAYSTSNDKIVSGVFVKGVNVSGLNKQEARYKIEQAIKEKMSENLSLVHNEYETTVNLKQINAKFDIDSALEKAYEIGRGSNIIINTVEVLKTMVSNINIDPILTVDQEILTKELEDVSTKLPDTVIQSSYYIEGDELIITKGSKGQVVDVEQTTNKIEQAIQDLSYIDQKVEMITKEASPNEIDIEKIHQEIYKAPVDAYYTTNPYVVHPHENGVDFAISVEEAKAILAEEKAEYSIPLKYIAPSVTTNMIGNEAFPDLISSFSTRYNARDRDRTTNLILASNKINRTVVMPGETFSFNKVVGKRTIEAGYKDAPIYQDGKVVDGLAGGICQISTTLYNAVLYANLEIVERRNHQFVPSYSDPGLDATVVYGAIDFKFKNNREYPIKIICSVSGGVAKFELYGLRQQNEYQVELSSKVISTTATSIKSVTYKTVKQNGQVISSGIINRDTYKRH